MKGNSYKLKIHDDGHLELTSGTKNIWKTSPGPKKWSIFFLHIYIFIFIYMFTNKYYNI